MSSLVEDTSDACSHTGLARPSLRTFRQQSSSAWTLASSPLLPIKSTLFLSSFFAPPPISSDAVFRMGGQDALIVTVFAMFPQGPQAPPLRKPELFYDLA